MENEVKEPAPKYNYISPEEYLSIERKSERRNEYYNGHIVPMSACSLVHNKIQINLIRELGVYLRDKECAVLPSHMRVSTPSHDAYMYSDALIFCDKPELEDDQFDTLLNATVIFEILSPSTEGFDKTRKFLFYKEIPTLKEYFLIDSKQNSVTSVRRQTDNSWKLDTFKDPSATIMIETINFPFPIAEIYYQTGL